MVCGSCGGSRRAGENRDDEPLLKKWRSALITASLSNVFFVQWFHELKGIYIFTRPVLIICVCVCVFLFVFNFENARKHCEIIFQSHN